MLLLLKKVTWLSLVIGQTYTPSRGCTAVDRSVQSFYTEGICIFGSNNITSHKMYSLTHAMKMQTFLYP